MRRIVLVLLVIGAAYFGISQQQKYQTPDAARTTVEQAQVAQSNAERSKADAPIASDSTDAGANDAIVSAFANRQSDIVVHGVGTVEKVLKDDSQGSRHQRFLVNVAPGQTILIAHNIDLAERVAPLLTGDPVEFLGEYEWNAQGGVVHWTHRDPRGRHKAGWIKHDGHTFQ